MKWTLCSSQAPLKPRYVNLALLGGLAVSTVVTDPWLSPGLAGLAVGQALLVVFWLRAASGRASPGLMLGFLGLSYSGLAYLVAVLVGTPQTTGFWLTFLAALTIASPIVLLARQLLRRWASRGDLVGPVFANVTRARQLNGRPGASRAPRRPLHRASPGSHRNMRV